jgi:hypothetical protein
MSPVDPADRLSTQKHRADRNDYFDSDGCMDRNEERLAIRNRAAQAAVLVRQFMDGSPEPAADLSVAYDAARMLDQISYELHVLGESSPSCVAYAAAFVLNVFAGTALPIDRELGTQTLQFVSALERMLSEPDELPTATSAEPLGGGDHPSVFSSTIFHSDDSCGVDTESGSERDPFLPIRPQVSKLVDASELLLKKILCDGESPYASVVSQIYHLAIEINDLVGPVASTGVAAAPSSSSAEQSHASSVESQISELPGDSSTSNPRNGADCLEFNADTMPPNEMYVPHEPVAHSTGAVVKSGFETVLLIDESAFVRMLLTSAIESRGHAVCSAANLADAKSLPAPDKISVVVWGGSNWTDETNDLRAWLGETGLSDAVSERPIVALINADERNVESQSTFEYRIRRTDIAGLLDVISNLRNDFPFAGRKIA